MFRPLRLLVTAALAAMLATCDRGIAPDRWRDLGELPAAAATALNHTPLVVSGGRVLVGTSDGIWARPLDGTGAWTPAGLAGVAVFATRSDPADDATIFAAGQPVADLEAPPFYRSDDGGLSWIPSASFPRNSFDGSTEPFYDLALAPDDAGRLYANLSGPSIAISIDGGMNWSLANGETDVFFGDPCVIHIRAAAPTTLYQGCEAPLDDAWVATWDIDLANPFELSNFTFVAGGPDFALGNRRPNALASGPARRGTLYAGLEGALIALDGAGFEFVFKADDGAADPPYVYVSAIWLDPDDPDHLAFGGGVNGENESLALFETRDGGATQSRVRAPAPLSDPAVEQLVPVAGGLAVLVSESDPPGSGPRKLRLFVREAT